MKILKNRKLHEAKEIFKNFNCFLKFLKNINNNINFQNPIIIEKTILVYENMINKDGVIKWVRFDRWIPGQFNFCKKNILVLGFWLERGWSEEIAKNKISETCKKRSNLGTKTKLEKRKIIFEGKDVEIRFRDISFKCKEYPKCNICGENLVLKKININNVSNDFYYKIINCSNEYCGTKKCSNSDLYKSFLPKHLSENKIKDLNEKTKKRSVFCFEHWIDKGFSEQEAKNKVSEIQKKNAKKVIKRVKITKEFFKNKGYTNEEIINKTLTPTKIDFWIKKGYTEQEAKNIIGENQKKASSFVDYEKRVLPSNIEYWTDKGFSYVEARKKVKERQTTFSLEICIKKFGEDLGLKRWIERQEKWLKNYKKKNYSKVSQELFWELYNLLDVEYKKEKSIFFATLNKETGEKDIENRNNEFRLKLNKSYILPDFFVLEDKKIIEFDGTYYHRINPENELRELDRDKNIKESGYSVLHIGENDFKEKRENVIKECLKFLNLKK